MSGIYGMVSTGAKPPDEKRLVAMQSAFTHRGPASLHLRKAHVGLGQIIDASESGRTLLTNETQTLTLAFDGSISNYRDLREELLGLGHTFATRESAETILHLYEEHGEGLCTHLRGMFAFAIWDARQQCLFCARDRLGIKPQDSKEVMYENLRFDRLRISDKLRSLVLANPQLRWIEKREHLCSMEQQRCTVFYENGYAMIRDGAHLTFRSFEAFGAFLVLKMGVV